MKRIYRTIPFIFIICCLCSCGLKSKPIYYVSDSYCIPSVSESALTASLTEAESNAFENDSKKNIMTEPDILEIDTTKAAETVEQIICSETTETQTVAPTDVDMTIAKNQEKISESSTAYKSTNISFGSAGRLDIVSVHIGISLYLADLYDGNVQSIVDAQDSAAIFIYKDKIPVIADHNNQGFSSLKNVSVGNIAVISTPDGNKDEYICTRVCSAGHNMGTYLLDEYGKPTSIPA